MNFFEKKELVRYHRHLIIPEFNIEGQKRLKKARVLVVGAGGLGCPVLQYLTAAGVGNIGIMDDDIVDESNLQRQVIYTIDDIGQPKVKMAQKRLSALNPYVKFTLYQERLTSTNALSIVNDYDIVADGTDNFATRYLTNDACVLLDKVNVYASIYRFEGQVSVFNYLDAKGNRGPNYRDLFPEPPAAGSIPSCAEAGVLGILPGIIGSFQACEVIKIITGMGNPLSGKLVLFDTLTFQMKTIKVNRNPDNAINGKNPTIKDLIDYDAFCSIR